MKNIELATTRTEPSDHSEDRSLSIVVADDEERIRLLLTRSLKNLHHKVVGAASNGQEAVTLAGQLLPDLVILDIDMPLMNGIQAASAILENQEVPIIISTGTTNEANLRKLRNLNIGAYLVKPFSPAQLKAAIYIAMSRH